MSFLWPSTDDRLAELVEAARRGDRRAFQAFYLELYGPVARFVARRVRRREDVEEIVARVFHRVLERLGDFDAKRGNARMFVLRVARNLVIDHVRASRRDAPIERWFQEIIDRAQPRSRRAPRSARLPTASGGR